MTTHDELMSRFDALDADLGILLNHYRKVKRDRKALLEALKNLVALVEDGGECANPECTTCELLKPARHAIAQTESEE